MNPEDAASAPIELTEQSDQALVLAALAGNKHAFGELINRHQSGARRVATRLVRDYDLACELTQEAVLQAYLGLETLDSPARFAAWFRGIVRNLCRSHLRRQRPSFAPLDTVDTLPVQRQAPLGPQTRDPALSLEAEEERVTVQTAIASLSPKNQAATWLFYMEAMSVSEVARRLDATPGAVKGRLHQARKQLRAQLMPLFAAHKEPNAPLSQEQTMKIGDHNMANISAVKIYEDTPSNHTLLYLLDMENHRYLKLWIGDHEGEQIRLQLTGTPTARPMTYRYFADFLQLMEIQLEAVRVAKLHESTFYAVSQFRNGDVVKELDTRPSDAVGLALYAGAPIFVEDALLAQAGASLPTDQTADQWFAAEVERIQREQQIVEKWQQEIATPTATVLTQSARQAVHNAIALAQRFGHSYVGTEHLLYGLAEQRTETTARLLANHGVTPDALYRVTTARVGQPVAHAESKSSAAVAEPQLTARVGQVLEIAREESATNDQRRIGSEHLLLAILHEGNGMALTLLQDLAVERTVLQAELRAPGGEKPAA